MGAIFILISVVFGSLNPVWVKLAYSGGAEPLALNFWQGFFSILFYIGLVFLRGRDKYAVTKKELGQYLILGGIGMFLTITLMNMSMQYLQASYSVMLFFCNPAFVLLGGRLIYKTKLAGRDILTLIFILAGVYVITRPEGEPGNPVGILLAIASALAHTFYLLYGGHVAKADPLKVAFYVQIGFFAANTLFLPLAGLESLAVPAAQKYGFILALLASVIGTMSFLKGMSLVGAGRASLLAVTNLPLSLFFALLILKDQPTGYLLGGFVLILSGLLLDAAARYLKSKTEKKEIRETQHV